MTRRGRGADVAGAHSRRGSFPARGSDRPVPRTLCHVDRKLGLDVERYVGSDKYLVGFSEVRARLFNRTDVQATEV